MYHLACVQALWNPRQLLISAQHHLVGKTAFIIMMLKELGETVVVNFKRGSD